MSNTDISQQLMLCTKSNTDAFSFEGKEFLCKCVGVYDGDTVTVVFKPFENEPIYRYSIRLSGIDTPEIRTKNPDEKKKGLEVRDILRNEILDKLITIKCGKFDKYGRLLADIIYKGENINKWLISKGLAYEYNGGTKRIFS
jgi:endonuclease YncB( thermonuclease family)